MTEYYAHITQADDNNITQRVQTLEAHSTHVAELAAQFAAEFGCGDIARVMGLLHDKGKEQVEWQKYIQGVTGFNTKYSNIKSGPNHAYIGAHIAQILYSQLSPLIAQPIAGHHRGLYDYCEYIEETNKDIPKEVLIPESQSCAMPRLQNLKSYDFHHLVRILFSCLVDADSLDTEEFMNPEQASNRVVHTTMEELLSKLEEFLSHLKDLLF